MARTGESLNLLVVLEFEGMAGPQKITDFIGKVLSKKLSSIGVLKN